MLALRILAAHWGNIVVTRFTIYMIWKQTKFSGETFQREALSTHSSLSLFTLHDHCNRNFQVPLPHGRNKFQPNINLCQNIFVDVQSNSRNINRIILIFVWNLFCYFEVPAALIEGRTFLFLLYFIEWFVSMSWLILLQWVCFHAITLLLWVLADNVILVQCVVFYPYPFIT